MIEVVEVKKLQNKKLSITVICPRCGEEGTLRVGKRNIFGRPMKFLVVHGKEWKKKTCSFGSTSDEYEILREIYSIKEE